MRRTLVGTALTAVAVLAMAGPANAAVRPATAATAALTPVTITTDRTGGAFWQGDLIKTSTGSKMKVWHVDFDVSSAPGVTVLNASSCVDYFDGNGTFTKETCTSGQVGTFTHTFDVSDLGSARVSASGIPAQTCSVDANFQPIGSCKAAAPISVKVTWTGQGPITYTKFSQYIPGVYSFVQRSRDRGAVAAGTFNGMSRGESTGAHLGTSTTKEAGNPCGSASGTFVVPNGC
jgi:hypothetical protein